MSKPIYFIQKGKLAFADKLIFENLETYIYKEDKICLTGANGAGKSSFLKVIADIYQLDAGQIYKHPNLRIEYLEQEAQINSDDSFASLLPKGDGLDKKEVEIILRALSVPEDTPLKSLSGGQQRRAALALALIKMPDVLLLDEPTNHLDIIAIQWLESYVVNYPNAVICISHDRSFLNNVTNKIWWLDRGVIRSSDRGFGFFDQWREQIIEQEEAELVKLNKKLDAENLWLQQGVTARRKRNQGRLGQLRLLRSEIQQKNTMQKSLHNKIIAISSEQKKSKFIIEANNISFGYNDKILLKDFSIRIIKGERIGIIGPNGAGKSTFIKLLVKELDPCEGKVKHGDGLDITYLDQHREDLDGTLTLAQFLSNGGADNIQLGDGNVMHVAAYLKNFMFDPALMHAKVSILSGGQANRLLLAKALIKPGNLLILDEPTNDLDIDSLEMLLEILYEYQGTLIVISHDRDFLNRLSTRTLVFTGTEIIDFVGGVENYQQYLKKPAIKEVSRNGAPKEGKDKPNAIEPKATKLSYKEQRYLDVNLIEIEKLEKFAASIEETFASDADLYTKNFDKFTKLNNELMQIRSQIEILTEQWMIASEKLSDITKTKSSRP